MPSPDSTVTNQLLRQVNDGDRAALDQLLERYRPYVRRLVELRMSSKLKRRVAASDVVQDTHIEVVRRIEDYLERRPMSFRVWLRQTAHERVMMMYRHHVDAQRRSVDREVSLPGHSSVALARQLMEGGLSKEFQRRELAGRVRRAIESLSDDDREILLMRNFEELTNQEAAEALGSNPVAASKRYGRALIRLRNVLVESGFSG